MLPKNFVKTFYKVSDYKNWLIQQEIKIVSVVTFDSQIVVTYTLH